MEPDKMLDELIEKKELIATQLVEMEKVFNEKREQYLKVHQHLNNGTRLVFLSFLPLCL